MKKLIGDPLFEVIKKLKYDDILSLIEADNEVKLWFERKSEYIYRYLLDRDFKIKNFAGHQEALYLYVLDGYRDDVLHELGIVYDTEDNSGFEFARLLERECEDHPDGPIAKFFHDFHSHQHNGILVAPSNNSLQMYKLQFELDDLYEFPGVELLQNHVGYRHGHTFTSLNGDNFDMRDPRAIDELGYIDDIDIIREEFVDIHVDLVGKGILLIVCNGVLMTPIQNRDWDQQ